IGDPEDEIAVPVAAQEVLSGARVRDAVPVEIRGRGRQRALENEQTRATERPILHDELERGIALQIPESGNESVAGDFPGRALEPSTEVERQEGVRGDAKLVAAVAVQIDRG